MNILAPSILAADCTIMGEQINSVKEGGAKYLHIDVMDGVFVPSISYGMCVVQSLRKIKDIVFDVHLMITEPIRYIEEFAKAGADIITVHLEACEDVEATLLKIKECGCKVGLSIKPATSVAEVMPWLGGQKFMEASVGRVQELRRMITDGGFAEDVEVDGGINIHNVDTIVEAGANVIVAGSAVFGGDVLANTKAFVDKLSTGVIW